MTFRKTQNTHKWRGGEVINQSLMISQVFSLNHQNVGKDGKILLKDHFTTLRI